MHNGSCLFNLWCQTPDVRGTIVKIQHECIPCLIRQAYEVSSLLTDDVKLQQQIIRFALEDLSDITFEENAPYLSMRLHQYVKQVTGNPDPYKPYKVKFNQIAEEMIGKFQLRDLIRQSDDPFDIACRLSIAGNIIDFGLGVELDAESVDQSIQESLKAAIFGLSTRDLHQRVQTARNIMILADNAGEIVFDKLLVEQLPRDRVVYVVKGGPIVNDATMEDAVDVGMDQLVQVIDNGMEAQGTMFDGVSDTFMQAYHAADLIIAKGQANYETLIDTADPRLVFMLRAKCQSLAQVIGCQRGDFVICGTGHR